jgi:outer membrane protein OmpA-like peptidoglycan-associated protein
MCPKCRSVIQVGLLLLVLWLAACAAPQVKPEKMKVTDDPSAELTALTEEVLAGRQQQLNELSPDWFARAGKSLEAARKGMSLGEPAARIFENIAFGKTYLEKAKDTALMAKAVIGPTMDARNAAIKANAMDFAKEYAAIESDFLDLTRDIEAGKIARARTASPGVTRAYADLELRAIKQGVLGDIRLLLAKAEKNQAARLAPATLDEARKALASADQYITEQRYEREQMLKKAASALFQVNRLEQVMIQVKKIDTMRQEETVLWFEDMLKQTTDSLNAPDMRDQEWPVQLQNIHASIIALQKDNQFLQKKVKDDRAVLEARIKEKQQETAELKAKIAVLEGESLEAQKARELLEAKEREIQATLEAEHRFQLQFVEVQDLFSADQAEVYKQGHDLVIRLKAIRFPVGQAFITPDNYALLSTVRSAIHTFGDPEVVIEGHTDSSGSSAANEKLSQQRANAVREYFVANEVLKPEKVIAIGYGAERPLMKNDSSAGRAMNRRIDVIIHTAE